MARTLEWSELKTGLIGTATVAAFVIGILFFARVGQLRGDTGTLYVYADDADGVMPGTEVWLSGEKIGQVKRIRYRPVTTDTLRRLSIETLILASRMPYIRRDSRVDIRPGGNLIGTPVINITGGTSRARALVSGDTLVSVSNSAFKPVGERVSALGDRLTVLADSANKLTELINSTSGTLGAFNERGLAKIPDAVGAINTLMAQVSRGDGSLGLIMQSDIPARVARIGATKDSIVALMSSDEGTIGRFRSDSTLLREVAKLQSDLDSLKLKFAGKGFIAQSRADSSLSVQMTRMKAELAALMAELGKNPRRFIQF